MTTVDYRLNEIWTKTLKAILDSSQLKKDDFDSYFSDTYLGRLDEDLAVVVTPSFAALVLMEQSV